MGVPANGTMVYLAFFPSVHLIMVRERLGTTRPMHCSALGKAYLSALDDRALDSELALLTYRGGTERAARGPIELRERLEETRKRGYAIDRDETSEGATCVAAPSGSAAPWSARSASPVRRAASATSASPRSARASSRSRAAWQGRSGDRDATRPRQAHRHVADRRAR